jgi:hypothetical protein
VSLDLSVQRGAEVLRREGVRFEPGEVRDVVYRIGAGATVRGFLLGADGAPCPQADLWLVRGEKSRMLEGRDAPERVARTTDDGSFELAGVRAGDWLLGPSKQSSLATWMTHFEVPENAPTVDIVLRLPRILSLQGRTVGPAGEPLADVAINARGDGVFERTVSGADGGFQFEALPEGPVSLEAGHGPGDLIGPERVQARAGDVDVVIVLSAGGHLDVRVRDESGRAVAAMVRCSPAVDGPFNTWITHAEDGSGTLRGLPDGLYAVVARTDGGFVGSGGPVRLSAGSRVKLDIVVGAGGRLRVKPLPSDSCALLVFQNGALVESLRSRRSEFVTTETVPPGPATVQIAMPDGSVLTRDATVIAGETVNVVFDRP